MLVKKYIAEVVCVVNPVDALYVIELRSAEKPFKFLPGQFLHLALDLYDPSEGWPESRCFSIQAQNGPDRLIFTFSARGRYTERMVQELALGKLVSVKLPYGSLFNDVPAERTCVFVAGGTGITPFLSLFTDSSFSRYTKPVLYAGFRSKEYDLYGKYLSRGREINPAFEFHLRYEDAEGMLDIGQIIGEQEKGAVYFLSGPPEMIRLFRGYLENHGVAAEDIRTDDWE